MSQAAASMTYHIPKTTIWRRLQQDGKKSERSLSSKKQRISDSKHNIETKVEGSDFTYCEVLEVMRIFYYFLYIDFDKFYLITKFYLQVSSEIPITYIDENSIPEDSVIILTAEDMDGLNLEEGRQIIVNSVCFLFINFFKIRYIEIHKNCIYIIYFLFRNQDKNMFLVL